MQNKDWHSLSMQEVVKELKTSKTGLSEKEAQKRIAKFGKNKLPEKKSFTYLGVALSQFKSPMVYILLIAAMISFLLREYIDVWVILFAVFLNTIVGFVQEVKAETALAALSSVVAHKTYVIRDGIEKEIDTTDVTVGDIVVLKSGGRVPADGRVLETYEMEIDEAVLTGESAPIQKIVKGLDQEGESKRNMIYMGSSVVKGRGLAVITNIALNTKFGQIADLLDKTEDADTPLQIELTKFSKYFGKVTLVILIVVMAIGLFRGIPFLEIFTTAVAMAVAAIPEGMLVAVTIILAVGMQRILKNGSLVRKLVAAETLGSVSTICTDKTGTLTKGTMQIDHIVMLDSFFVVNNNSKGVRKKKIEEEGEHMVALRIGMLCNDAVIENPAAGFEDWVIHGEYTEKAFLWAGLCAGFSPITLKKESVRINEIPFSSDRKLMATLNKEGEEYYIYVKGAAEEIINRSRHIFVKGKTREMNEDDLRRMRQKQEDMSREGLRVLGVAFRKTDKKMVPLCKESNEEDIVNNLVLVGLIALKDPLREEAKSTLDTAKEAGIRTIMITGDNPLTAKAIANELGMKVEKENILEGVELDRMSTKDFSSIVSRIKVYARVSPRHKLRIVEAWQTRGEVVAMTGDGVNDAPALKKADIGIALGSGTEVAKETANLVLLDDNFKTIIVAIRQGRAIFDNIRKVVLYLISDSFSEVIIVGGSLLIGTAMPLTAAQILWINLITDGLPNVALTQEPEEEGVMQQKPRKKNEPLLNTEMKTLVIVISMISGVVALIIFEYINSSTGDFRLASSVVFSLLAVDSLIYVFSLRSLRRSIFKQNPFSNPYLIVALALAFSLQLVAIYVPFFQNILETKALGLGEWEVIVTAGFFTVLMIEAIKYIFIKEGKYNK
ncbi:MAG: cation-transporting P-type ATPase [Candidatus Pacebacteria bacterium]|nr:cation-transporting P-type ATPase [Candidatus Paceibacterota bacterium]